MISNSRFRAILHAFDQGTLKESDFGHAEHVAVALWYLAQYKELDAIVRIKGGILYYNRLFQTPQGNGRGYHETITLFFIRHLQQHRNGKPNAPLDALVDSYLTKFPSLKDSLAPYYSPELIGGNVARVQWMAPDLSPLS